MRAADLRAQAARLLRSADGPSDREARDLQRDAAQLLRMADLIDRGSVTSEQSPNRKVLKPKF
jgi:hypothetical protein